MTIATAAQSARPAQRDLRLEVAWSVSARAMGGGHTFASAVLHAEAAWTAPGSAGTHAGQEQAPRETPLHLTVQVLAGALTRVVSLPAPCVASLEHRGSWTHLRVSANGDLLIRASFEHGRLIYCTGSLPLHAGLAGATYDAPTGTLDMLPALP